MNTLLGVAALLAGAQVVFTFSDEGMILYRFLTSPSAPVDWLGCLGCSQNAPMFFLLIFMLLAIVLLAWHHGTPLRHDKRHFHKYAHK